jgi:Na+/H+ antiporter NhaD/arsenite permease-like protein
MPLSVVILGVVLVLIAVRQLLRIRLRIWQIMLGGAIAVLITGQISLSQAADAIDLNVILFLFGIFIVGGALGDSGYLANVSQTLLGHVRSTYQLLAMVLCCSAIASAFLMNDTIAIIGTPVMLGLSRQTSVNIKPLLLSMAFGITLGSTASPIGNPQNLLIAAKMASGGSFIIFGRYLLIPTLLNVCAAFLLLRWMYRKEPRLIRQHSPMLPAKIERRPAIVLKVSLAVLIGLICLRIAAYAAGMRHGFEFSYIALSSAAVVIAGMPGRLRILKQLDWSTLVFFASMFVLMQSVWNTNLFQNTLAYLGPHVHSLPAILMLGVLGSQVISNVPLVAMYLPVLAQAQVSDVQYMALAAGSTIAGNLTILGAASNIIIIQNAEAYTGRSLSFGDFIKCGLPLTAVNVVICWLCLNFL